MIPSLANLEDAYGGVDFAAECQTAQEAWGICSNVDWMLWIIREHAPQGHRVVVGLAADALEQALHLVEVKHRKRVQSTIIAARAWCENPTPEAAHVAMGHERWDWAYQLQEVAIKAEDRMREINGKAGEKAHKKALAAGSSEYEANLAFDKAYAESLALLAPEKDMKVSTGILAECAANLGDLVSDTEDECGEMCGIDIFKGVLSALDEHMGAPVTVPAEKAWQLARIRAVVPVCPIPD